MDDIATGAVVVQSVLHSISMWPSDRQTDIQTTEHVTSVAESCIYATHAMQHRRWYTSPTDDLQQCVYIGVAGSNRTHWTFPPVQNCVMWRTNLQYDVAVILSLMRVSISPCFLLPLFAFSALMLLAGWKEWHPACKNWAVGCWHGYLSGARCRLAYGPADATATHCLLLQ